MSTPAPDIYRDIVDVVLRFGRALDENDWVAYRACLKDSILVDYQDVGLAEVLTSSDDWTALVRAAVTPQATVHYFTNFQVDLNGSAASCVFAHQSSHFVATAAGDPVYTQHGRYSTELHRDDAGQWKFARIVHRVSFATGNPAVAGPPDSALLDAQQRIYG